MNLPVGLHARPGAMEIDFTDPLEAASAGDARNFTVKVWALKRSADYGSKHINEHSLTVTRTSLGADRKTVLVEIAGLQPTWCMESNVPCAARMAKIHANHPQYDPPAGHPIRGSKIAGRDALPRSSVPDISR